MGSLCIDFQAEMIEIPRYTELPLSKNVTRRKRYSYCGSRAAIVAIAAVAAIAAIIIIIIIIIIILLL
jgi:hypothetical protein